MAEGLLLLRSRFGLYICPNLYGDSYTINPKKTTYYLLYSFQNWLTQSPTPAMMLGFLILIMVMLINGIDSTKVKLKS